MLLSTILSVLFAIAGIEPGEPLSAWDVWALAYYVSGDEQWADEAMAVAWCESSFNPEAVGSYAEEGLMQVRAVYWGAVSRDPLGQMRQARMVWESTGDWRWWSCQP